MANALVAVGIDVSLTATGIVAYRIRSKRVEANALLHTKVDHTSEYDLQQRIDYIASGVLTYVRQYEKPLVAIENAAFGAQHSNTRQHEVVGVVKHALWQAGIRFQLFATTALKVTATGNGRASKEEMVAAACAAGFACTDHNLADAYWCARHAVEYARVMA